MRIELPTIELESLNGTFEAKLLVVPKYPDVLKIGRHTSNNSKPHISNGFFDAKVLSRSHAELWHDDHNVYIKDIGSSNGTFVNGKRLSMTNTSSEPLALKKGDILEFGFDVYNEDDSQSILYRHVAAKISKCSLDSKEKQEEIILNVAQGLVNLDEIAQNLALANEKLSSKSISIKDFNEKVMSGSRVTILKNDSDGTVVEGDRLDRGSDNGDRVEHNTVGEGETLDYDEDGIVESGSNEDGMVESGSNGIVETGSNDIIELGSDEDDIIERGSDEDSIVERGSDEDSIVESGSDEDSIVESVSDEDGIVKRVSDSSDLEDNLITIENSSTTELSDSSSTSTNRSSVNQTENHSSKTSKSSSLSIPTNSSKTKDQNEHESNGSECSNQIIKNETTKMILKYLVSVILGGMTGYHMYKYFTKLRDT